MLPVSHAECMIAGGALDLIALCDARIDKAREASITYGVRSYFADVTAMLRAEVPAVVSVATRTRERPSVVRTLAENGVRGIYAEKPFSRSLGECTLAIGAIDTAGAKLVLGTPRRYMRLYRRAHEIITSGQLGALTQVRIQLARGSTLLWSVPHSVDLLAYFSGTREVAYVQGNCHIPDEAVVDDVIDCDPTVEAVTILFENGVIGTLHAGIRFAVTLVCDYAEVHVFESRPLIRVVHLPSSTLSGLTDEFIDDNMSGTMRAFIELAAATEHGTPAAVTLEDVVLNQELLTAIAASSIQGGRRIRLSDLSPNLIITGKIGALYA